ncbi:hypothetical protein K435DRAFT_859344 [Dendrothele bispora CBS 962.96]|uniref:Uncharacterized protein n=1 Tax=Dendrothele bispora (strain CBS 962.96) TaxID=1314807 RepID=A0A4S8M215_DENBC|nr:hypothetical protein K435DRAFT_859344 [Dendrothele bispora CBS 962.96]
MYGQHIPMNNPSASNIAGDNNLGNINALGMMPYTKNMQGFLGFPGENINNVNSFPSDMHMVGYNPMGRSAGGQSPFSEGTNQDFSSSTPLRSISSSPNPKFPNGLIAALQTDIFTLQKEQKELRETTEKQCSELEIAKKAAEGTQKEIDTLKLQIQEVQGQPVTTNKTGKAGGVRKPRDRVLEGLIHNKAHGALGLKYRHGVTAILPDPLGSNEEPRTEGNHKLHNPDWTKDACEQVNLDFIDDITTMVVNHIKADESMKVQEANNIHPSVKKYFETLTENYK